MKECSVMQEFPLCSVYNGSSINKRKEMVKMKTMKICVIVFAMLAAFSLASCSSDDDELQTGQLAGTWEQVYDEGVIAEGYVQYTFTPGTPSTGGECTIYSYDVFAGDTVVQRDYALTDNGRRLVIFEGQYGGTPSEVNKYDVLKLSATWMTWHLIGSDVVLNFKKVK